MHAMLLCGGPIPKIVQQGPHANNVHNALCRLLVVTCSALEWYTENLLGTMHDPEECANGAVDHTMIEEGFHFAAEQRIVVGIYHTSAESEETQLIPSQAEIAVRTNGLE
jgi:hypothetical protein